MKNITNKKYNKKLFQENGFLIIENFLTKNELISLRNYLNKIIENDELKFKLDKNKFKSKFWMKKSLTNDILKFFVSNEKIVKFVKYLLMSEVYLWHSKFIVKEPKLGGAWEWHQDYSYWYYYNCLNSHLLSCFYSLTDMDKTNGCLQFLKGTHKLGRLDHHNIDGQNVVNNERIQFIENNFEKIYCEVPASSLIIFDSNILHKSSVNKSNKPRFSFICCYNSIHNTPFLEINGYSSKAVPIEIIKNYSI